MSDEKIKALYANRQYTIRELAKLSGRNRESVRRLLVRSGFQHTRLV